MCSITVITSLYNSHVFLDGYFSSVGDIPDTNEIEILLVHNAPNSNELAIIDRYLPMYPFIRHVIVEEREGLYSSWNRGIKLAKGAYIAIWNVDDTRTAHSLKAQKKALDQSNAAMCYGDFYGTNVFGNTDASNRLYQYPEFKLSKKAALRIHIIGCFPMWRKEIHQNIGYFDEQFKIVGDYEFQIRVALRYDLIKAEGTLGYYLENQGHKLSSNRRLLEKERTVVELRYKIYDKVLLHLIPSTLNFRIGQALNYGQWIPTTALIQSSTISGPNSFISLIVAPLTYFFWVVKRTLNALYHLFFR